jgi:S1-C subfamily serine protease
MSSVESTNVLVDLSARLSGAVDRAGEHVVSIHARRRIPSSGIVWRDGVIVSASHTVRHDGAVRITLPDGKQGEANVVGRDPATDLVVLRASGVVAAQLAEPDAGKVGSLVLAVGRPGRNLTASFGIVSAAIDGWRSGSGGRIDRVLRLDLSVYDGFSGGPLVAPSGQVLGINNSALARGGAAALPASVVDAVVDELLSRGHVRRPFIGIGVHPVALGPGIVKRHGLKSEAALVVVSVADGEAAEAAGLLIGDVLVGVGGESVARPTDLLDALAGVPDGASIELTVLRGGAKEVVTIVPRDRDRDGEAE